jgi:AcrR family transcriptional regulator
VPTVPTRERILRAAAAEFARYGVAGARVNRIAVTARANKERIYHHFGSKERLFEAVMNDAMMQIGAAEPFAADDLGAYAEAMLEFHRRHPELVQLLLAEARHRGDGELADEPTRAGHYKRRAQAVLRAQAGGAVREDVDPRFVVFTILALIVTAEALPRLTDLVLGDARLGEELTALLSQERPAGRPEN